MNSFTLSLTSVNSSSTIPMPAVDLFDMTELSLDLSEVYSNIFPNYLAIEWGDGSSIEKPDITIYRNYKTESIFPEIKRGASPVFFNKPYKHIFYPSDTALKKEMTMRVNVGYIDGNTTKFSIPVNVRTEGYLDTIEDLDLLNVSLLDSEENNSIYTYLTKKDNFVIQNHDDTTIEYSDLHTTTLSSYHDTSNSSIQELFSLISAVPDPVGAEAKFQFIENLTDESATWKTSFWGYSNRSVINFSGTTYRSPDFRSDNNLTLISPRHAVGVSHFSDDPKANDDVYFYDFTTGNSISATISAAVDVGLDLRVVSFDRDLSTATTSSGAAGSLKLYKLPQFDNEVPADTFPVIVQGGNFIFDEGLVGFQDQYAGVATSKEIASISNSRSFYGEIVQKINPSVIVGLAPPALPDFRLTNVSPILSAANLSLSGYAPGDSGGPIFIPYNNELLLLGIAQSAGIGSGSGKNFGTKQIRDIISAGMETVGNTWGYQLSTVRLS